MNYEGSEYKIVGHRKNGTPIWAHVPVPAAPVAPPPPPVQAAPKPPLRITKRQTVGVKKNTKTKNKSKDNLRIGRTSNVQPLQAGAVGYTGLRIS